MAKVKPREEIAAFRGFLGPGLDIEIQSGYQACLSPSLRAALLEPEERANAANALELDLQFAAGHRSAFAPPAGLMIEIGAIHVEALAELLNFALVARQPLVVD